MNNSYLVNPFSLIFIELWYRSLSPTILLNLNRTCFQENYCSGTIKKMIVKCHGRGLKTHTKYG